MSHRAGFVERLEEARRLAATTIKAADLPGDLRALVVGLLDLGGTYGDPTAGDPIQYDDLRIQHDQGEVEIVVYNRAILLSTTDSEAIRRIHEVCCRLEKLRGARNGVETGRWQTSGCRR